MENYPVKKILIFSPFYPPHIGGLESHSDEFNKHLSQRNVTLSVFTPRLPEDAPETEIHHNDVKIIRFSAFEPIHNYPIPKFWQTNFWQRWNSLSDENYDIIISRTRFFFPSLMALRYARKNNIPLVHIEHGSDFAQFNGSIKTLLAKFYDWTFGRCILRSANCVIGNSSASADFVRKLSGRNDCSVIYRGANIAGIEKCILHRDLKEKYQDKTIIAFIGRLIDGKGAHDLITAIAQMKRNNIVTFIIGGGPEEMRLKKMATTYNLEDQIVFFGNLPFDEAISVLKTADIVVNPSYTEGLPTSVTESALCQKAIIATNVGGTSEVISGNGDGYLIEPKNIEQLREKLTDLIDHPEKRILFGQNAYQEVKNKFSWDHAINQYLEIFSKLLDNKK
ncbi:MAG: glycosyltransferase family 4 protein [Candidatus Moranbacteria bacterium]|nr:glycosyltransferase family 4 protein [Candidatus Moranbacteria bacterium]MDD3964950.1 glycosyltransferase family 4 protein [Candidatus Moranbacteria bacterium]